MAVPLPLPALYKDWQSWAAAVLRYLQALRLPEIGSGSEVPKIPTRLAGPALVSNAATTVYTTPAKKRTVIRNIHVQNPTGGAVTFTLSIGADAAAKRLFDAFPLAAGTYLSLDTYIVLDAGEIVQTFSGTNNVLTLTVSGEEEAA